MKPSRLYILILCLLSLHASLFAEEEKPVSAIPWYNIQMLESPYESATRIEDTLHTGFHLYDFFSPRNPFVANKGNVGHASRLLRFDYDCSSHFQLFPAEPYQHYRFLHEELRFYRPNHVFTDLFHVTGSNREQFFYAKHSQRFHDKIYAGVNYRLVNSPGEFSRMGARMSNVYLTFDFRNKDDRYQLLASFISNRFENQESGGLKNHLAYEENPVRDSVFMYSAMSRYSETAININHFYRTGFYNITHTDDEETRQFVNLGRVNHNFSFTRRAFVLDENTRPANFYDVQPKQSDATLDSTLVLILENQFSWSNFPMEREGFSFPFNFRLSLTHRYVSIQQPMFPDPNGEQADKDTYLTDSHTFNQVVPGISVESDRSRFLSFDAHTHLTIGGYNDEDFDLGGNLYLGRPDSESVFGASAFFLLREAPYFFSHFSGNYVSWDNDFYKSNILRLSAKWQFRTIETEAAYFLLNNMVFMNTRALPEQNTNAFSVITAAVSASPGIGFLRSHHKLLFQFASDDQYDRFPVFISYHSVFADLALFKKALFVNVGVDLTYNAPYRPMAYMPVVRQFYVQDGYDSGHVFLVDAFLTAKVKRTRFFLRFQNLAGLITNTPPVYSIPFHPLPETGFKFGISWMFFN